MSGTVAWFGVPLGAPVYEDAPEVPTPVGEPCVHCPEPIAESDSGFTLPYASPHGPVRVAYHRECFLREVLGGVLDLSGGES